MGAETLGEIGSLQFAWIGWTEPSAYTFYKVGTGHQLGL